MTEENTSKGRKPEIGAFNVRDTPDGKGFWTQIGAAWQHRDGQGYDLKLDSVPVDGRVTLRELRDERMQGYAEDRRSQEPTDERTRDNRTQGHGRER